MSENAKKDLYSARNIECVLEKRGITLKVFWQIILHVQQHLDPRYFSAFKNTAILKTERPLGTKLCSTAVLYRVALMHTVGKTAGT